MHADLAERYAEPHRAYHVLAHIERCLAELDAIRILATDPDAVEAALWFHDAIYDPAARDNEALSARLASDRLMSANVLPGRAAAIAELIMATRHDVPPVSPDGQLIADIDLAILGAGRAEFEAYETGIRREYAFLPDDAFRAGRAAVLHRFLVRASIYATEEFRSRLEARARENLARSVAAPAVPHTPPNVAPSG